MFFGRWCRRYAALFAAVRGTFYTTARVNAARFKAGGVGGMLPNLLLLVPPFTQRRVLMLPVSRPLVWASCCTFYCCRCRLLRYGEVKYCPFFIRLL